jgi:hypothetical protein
VGFLFVCFLFFSLGFGLLVCFCFSFALRVVEKENKIFGGTFFDRGGSPWKKSLIRVCNITKMGFTKFYTMSICLCHKAFYSCRIVAFQKKEIDNRQES